MRDDVAKGRFEIASGGQTVFADYRRRDRLLYIDHVEAAPALRGKGAAGELMQAIVDQARAEGREIVPVCSYAAHWLAHARRRDPTAGGEGPA